ncbi:MAG: hypothetical protein ABI596_12915 [Pyrinomonadaceae bacterium]
MKRHPLAIAALIIVLGILIGLVAGWGMAQYETGEIARQVRARNPNDPLDGLPFIGLGIMLIGFVLGTVTGIVGAVVFWLTNRARAGKQGKELVENASH